MADCLIRQIPMTPPAKRPTRTENLDLNRMRRLYRAALLCSRATRNGAGRAVIGTEVPAMLDLRPGDVIGTPQITPAMQLLAGAEPPRPGQESSSGSGSALAVQLGLASGIALRARQ